MTDLLNKKLDLLEFELFKSWPESQFISTLKGLIYVGKGSIVISSNYCSTRNSTGIDIS